MKTQLLFCCALFFAGAVDAQEPQPARIPPAALLDVSSHLINTFVERPVQRTEPVYDWILDNEVTGMGHTCGKVHLHVQPDPHRALLAIVLRGTSTLDTVGYQDPVKAYTRTVVNFEVKQPISIDERGLHVHPTLSCAGARVCLIKMTNYMDDPGANSIGFGRQQFYDDKPQIEAISAKKTEKKTVDSFVQELRPQIDSAAQGLRKAVKFVEEFGLSVQPLRFSATCYHLHVEAGLVTSAPLYAPPELPVSSDLSVRIHQSVLRTLAQKNLPGKTYSPLDLLKLRDTLGSLASGAPVPATPDVSEMLKRLKIEPASITFARQTPIEVDMTGDGFTIVLNGSGFHQGGNDYPARSIRARYRIEAQGTEIVFVRQGGVEIIARGQTPKLDEAKEKAMKALLETSFNLFLPARLALPNITIPGERPMVLVPTQAMTTPGWLTLAWTRK